MTATAEAALDTPAVIRLAGITYKQLDWWATRGYLKPDRQRPGALPTSGNPRSWPPEELEIATRMGRLTAAGIPPPLAASFARTGWPRGEIAPGIVLEVARG
jgi:hypothetical protein